MFVLRHIEDDLSSASGIISPWSADGANLHPEPTCCDSGKRRSMKSASLRGLGSSRTARLLCWKCSSGVPGPMPEGGSTGAARRLKYEGQWALHDLDLVPQAVAGLTPLVQELLEQQIVIELTSPRPAIRSAAAGRARGRAGVPAPAPAQAGAHRHDGPRR